jgi:hypothetical protein
LSTKYLLKRKFVGSGKVCGFSMLCLTGVLILSLSSLTTLLSKVCSSL